MRRSDHFDLQVTLTDLRSVFNNVEPVSPWQGGDEDLAVKSRPLKVEALLEHHYRAADPFSLRFLSLEDRLIII